MANFKYNKEFIENMAKEFMELLITHHCADDTAIYFNGERYGSVYKIINDEDTYKFVKQEVTFHPIQITEYTVKNNILSFSTEGHLYDILNYDSAPKWFKDFCKKYDLYAEPATSWFYHFCPDKGEWEDWETDNYEVEEETYLVVGGNNLNCLPYIKAVAEFWFNLSKAYGDKGSCVLGAGFKFVYNNKKYKLAACSPYQGSLSWEHSKDLIHKCLEHIGCTNIRYDWGNMD